MISIIVPVYNVERYLETALDSILNSTYQDFEIILVDDGSTDKSGLICDQYRERDNRIRVVHQANSGASAARNTALDLARGEYIAFVDGDDSVHPMMLETLKAAIDSGDYDFSMVHYWFVEEKDRDSIWAENKKCPLNEYKELSQDAFMRGLLDNSDEALKYNFLWNKLYKRSLIDNIRFTQTSIEDMEWNCRVCMNMKAKKAILVKDKLYYYLHREDSLSRGIGERYLGRMSSYLLCLKDIPEDKTSLRTQCLDMLYKVMVYTHYDTKRKGDKDLFRRCKQLRSSIYKETKDDFMRCGLSQSKKMLLMLLYNVPAVYPIFKKVFEMKSKLRS